MYTTIEDDRGVDRSFFRSMTRILLVLLLSGGFLLQGIVSSNQNRAYAYEVGSYEIWVNRLQNVVTVYQYTNKGYWVPVKAMICSTGKNNSTPLGTFSVSSKRVWGYLFGGVSGQYTTQFYGDFLFHSVPYSSYGVKSSLKTDYYNLLGQQASMGCVRLQVADAKWIYYYCPYGTPVHIYESSNPPDLGKPTVFTLTSGIGWDPTDPDPANPYQRNVTGIHITTPTGRVLLNGEQLQLSSELVTSGSINDCARQIRWESSNASVATVSSTGLVTARANGSAVIRVISISGREASYTIRVGKRVTTLNIESPLSLLSGSRTNMEVSALPADASYPVARYSSSDPAIASVTPEGLIQGVSPGMTTITATAVDGSGVTTQRAVEVYNYQVDFRDWDGSLISGQSLSYGGTVSYPQNPQRPEDESSSYSFQYWDKVLDQDDHLITATALYRADPLEPAFLSPEAEGLLSPEAGGPVSPEARGLLSPGGEVSGELALTVDASETSVQQTDDQEPVEQEIALKETDGLETGVQEYSGFNRYDTSDLVATDFAPQSTRAVITTGRDFPDALASSTLAGVDGCPLLLTDSAQLSWETYFSLFKLNVTEATVVGGTNAVSSLVYERIAQVLRENASARGGESISRIAGSDRFDTAQQIYNHLAQSDLAQTAIVTTGSNFPDALSVAPYAYAQRAPIFLVDSTGHVSATSRQSIIDGSFERVLILGGEQAVPGALEQDLVNHLGRAGVVRIGAADRYGTSLAIARYVSGEGALSTVHLGIATGSNFPDALVSAALQGNRQGVLLLVDASTQGLICSDFISEQSANVVSTHWYGGTGVLTRNLRQQLLSLL